MHAPFLTIHNANGHIHLIIGTNAIAHHRSQRSLEVGAHSIVLSASSIPLHHALADNIARGRVSHIPRPLETADLTSLGRSEIDRVVDAVFITSGGISDLNTHIAAQCRRLRIPINVTDAPNLCTFTLPALYSDGPLQIGITTSGMGCKLAARIRRHVLSTLPPNLGQGIQRLGAMRRQVIEEDPARISAPSANGQTGDDEVETPEEESQGQKADFNQLPTPSKESVKERRLRWLGQICEHWPLTRLANITSSDIDVLLASYSSHVSSPSLSLAPHHPSGQRPRIILAGAGPGSPHLLTVATHKAIETATIILTDKLVPSAILELIPRRTPVHIAEKFPGNADAAQRQLLELGLEALRNGHHTVLRLKQGDPYIYGRGGEEVKFFRREGYDCLVLPGLSAAMAAPLVAGVPVTMRGVADEMRVLTGRGKQGKAPPPPGFVGGQTVVVLMVLGRLEGFVSSLVGKNGQSSKEEGDERGIVKEEGADLVVKANGAEPVALSTAEREAVVYASPLWPPQTACAIVERASCADQRVIRSSLAHIVEAFEELGARPPGLLILGQACEVLSLELEDQSGENESAKKSRPRWTVEEGYSELAAWMAEVNMGAVVNMKEEVQGPV